MPLYMQQRNELLAIATQPADEFVPTIKESYRYSSFLLGYRKL